MTTRKPGRAPAITLIVGTVVTLAVCAGVGALPAVIVGCSFVAAVAVGFIARWT